MKVFVNGKQLRLILKIRNLSQRDAALKIGITHVHFNKLLHHNSEPSPKTRRNILSAFRGIAWDKLFTMMDLSVSVSQLEDLRK